MSMISPRVGAAMVAQIKRTRRDETPQEKAEALRVIADAALRDLAAAHLEINRLRAENEQLRAVAIHSESVNKADVGLFINGRLVVNQVEAAKRLGVPQYKISRWLKAKKFETVAVPGRKYRLIYADSLHKPERGQPGRKKKH